MKVINCIVNQFLDFTNQSRLFSFLRKEIRFIVMAVLILPGSVAFGQTLYGIIYQGDNEGFLVTIDTSSGAATLVGDTGLGAMGPSGLTYVETMGRLYTITRLVEQRVYQVDPETAAVDPLPSMDRVPNPGALAYRAADDLLYTTYSNLSGSQIYQLNPVTGDIVTEVGEVNKGSIGGLTVRQSDGIIFGAAPSIDNFPPEMLFTVWPTPSPEPRDDDIGMTSRRIHGLGFHPDGRLFGSDGENLVEINPMSGAVVEEVGPFGPDIGTIGGIAFAPDPGGDVDAWIKDCRDDTGETPTHPAPCPEYWTSTDIWIDNNDDWIIDAPVEGEDNTVKAYIRNRGSGIAADVTVSFYYRDNSTGLVFPDGATLIGTDIVTVSPDSPVVASVTWTDLPAPPITGGHWCIGVVLGHPDDPAISPVAQPYNDNNVGIANLWFIAGQAGHMLPLPFSAGTGGQSGFGLTPWPRDFKLKVISKLPAGWDWTMKGIGANEPFTLKLGEERSTALKIKVAGDAKPHSGGQIEVQQVDLETGTVVGGVRYNLYEDHLPPKQVDKLKASLVDGKAVLTWKQTLVEAETGLRERVAYYEIIRNGEPLTKVLRDSDPYQPGMQWFDPDLLKKTTNYAVRVVDEGGNISKPSNKVTLKIPVAPTIHAATGIFNWLTWLLLISLLILMAWCLKTKKLHE